jgi:hypothetical protein
MLKLTSETKGQLDDVVLDEIKHPILIKFFLKNGSEWFVLRTINRDLILVGFKNSKDLTDIGLSSNNIGDVLTDDIFDLPNIYYRLCDPSEKVILSNKETEL